LLLDFSFSVVKIMSLVIKSHEIQSYKPINIGKLDKKLYPSEFVVHNSFGSKSLLCALMQGELV
jgi:hypothetical protein